MLVHRSKTTLAQLLFAVVLIVAIEQCSTSTESPDSKRSDREFAGDCLRAHNKWRRLHGAPKLMIDNKVTSFAQERADFIAESDGKEFKHPDDLKFGENLAWHSDSSQTCASLVKMWYDEIKLYDFNRATFDQETGHFTQVVWRGSKRLGCAKAISSGSRGGVYLVCNYDPPGNVMGAFKENVLRKKHGRGKATSSERTLSLERLLFKSQSMNHGDEPLMSRPSDLGDHSKFKNRRRSHVRERWDDRR